MKLPSPQAAPPSDCPAWQGYGFAAMMLVLALVVRWMLDPYIGEAVPLVTIYIGVAFAVWFGGWKPAAVMTAIGYVIALWWFLPPRFTFKLWEPLGPLRATFYWASCSVTIAVCESLRRTRRKHAESEARLMSILENMREGFLSVDDTWRITAVNRSIESLLGQSRDHLLGRGFWEVLTGFAGKPIEAELRRAQDERVTRQFETNAVSAGTWQAVTATPVAGGVSLFFHDITAQKAQVDQLERLVDDRTAALQRLVADLESFSYTLVHDMRAPLRSITGFAEILAVDHATQLDSDGRRHVARIQTAARRMDQLIVDILSYSQLSRGRPELRPVDLDPMLRDILRHVPDFQPDQAAIEIEGILPTVQGNEALLTQCFSNLLHNAVKFVAPGVKPRIHLAAHASGGRVRIDVVDNGIGVAPESRLRIFEPFHREHPQYDGTGIGLAIVRKVVDQLGGRVGVESELGHGSRFWVELLLAGPEPVPAATQVEARVLA